MFPDVHILADGIPPGLIFAGAVFALWLLGNVFGTKAKPADLKRPSQAAQDLAEARRRIREQQNAQKPPVTPRVWQKQLKQQRQPARNQKPAKQRPPALPTATPIAVRTVEAVIQRASLPVPAKEMPEIGAASLSKPRSETVRNVRLMLQRNGIAEAFVLGEILGKPKAFADD